MKIYVVLWDYQLGATCDTSQFFIDNEPELIIMNLKIRLTPPTAEKGKRK